MHLFQKRKLLQKQNALELVPAKLAEAKISENNLVVVLVPRFTNYLARKYIMPKLRSPYLKLNLDQVGSAVWNIINGQKNIEDIASILKSQFTKDEHFEQSLVYFISKLYEQKLITFVIPQR